MRFLRFLRSLKGFWPLSIVLWLAGLVLCVLLLPLVTEERDMIFIAMALVTAVWLLAVVLRQYSRIRAERNIKNLVELEVHREASDSEQGDYQILSERLKHAMEMQRAARSVDGGKASLYEMPWYLVVGMTASGKTSLLTRSGLSATMAGGSNLSSVSGTQHCDWYFSREAVMVDTAGRYLTEDGPASEFSNFLKTLRKQRRKPAINGLVLVVSLPELLEQSRQEKHALAEQLVARLDEYRHCLGVNPPLYLFFSKADLLPGFTRAFESLSLSERQTPWGLTFSLDELRRQGVTQAFQNRFPDVVSKLRNRIEKRVNEEGEHADNDLLRFPDYFAELSGVLGDFLEQFDAQKNPERAPILRGMYFTSALQTGDSLPALLDEKTRSDFALAESNTAPVVAAAEKSYFITDAFRKVIFPDRNLSLYYSKHGEQRSLPGLLIGGMAILGVVAVVAQSWSAYNNKQWLAGIQHKLEAFDSQTPLDGQQRSAELDTLGQQLATIEQYHQNGAPFRLGVGLYQGDNIREPLKAAWAAVFKQDVLQPLAGHLSAQLRSLDEGFGGFAGSAQPEDEKSADAAKRGASIAANAAHNVTSQGRALGKDSLERMKERSTSTPTVGSIPTSASELGSRLRGEVRTRTTDNVREAWYSARGNAEMSLEEGVRNRTHSMGSSVTNGRAQDGTLKLSGEHAPSMPEEMLTRLSSEEVKELIGSYSTLRFYLILTEPNQHPDQSRFVSTALPNLWADYVDEHGLNTSADSIVNNSALYVRYLQQGEAPAVEQDKTLVANSRDRLNSFLIDSTLVNREYLRYQLAVKQQYKPLTLSRMVPGIKRRVVYSSRAVPAFYTKKAWDEYVRPAIIKTVSGDLHHETDWVLDDKNVNDAVQNKARFVSQLMARYKHDYAVAWERFLGSTHVARFKTLDGASVGLAQLSDLQESPLRKIMLAINDNTTWDNPQKASEGGTGSNTNSGFWTRVMSVLDNGKSAGAAVDLATLPKINDGTLAEHFSPVARLLAADDVAGSDNTVLNQYLLDLRQLKVRIDAVRHSRNVGKSSKTLLVSTLLGKANEINNLRNFVASRINISRTPLVAAMDPLFSAPVTHTQSALMGPAQAQINSAWDDKVVKPWNQMIANRYPVTDSVNEASVRDMERFIDPDSGILSQFRKQEIGDLIDTDDGDSSDMVDPRMLLSINNGTDLGQIIDSLSDLRNGFELQMNPTPGLTDVILTIDGQRLHYRNNSQSWKRITWPGDGKSTGARLDIINSAGRRYTVFDYPGRWGFLRMIESAHITPVDGARQRFSWNTPMGVESFDVRNFGGVKVSDLRKIKFLHLPSM